MALPRSRLLGEGSTSVLGLVLNRTSRLPTLQQPRWDQPDLAMRRKVEPVDVLGDRDRGRDLEVVDPAPRAFFADKFGLEQRVERLGHGVVRQSPLLPTEATASASARRSA